MEPIKNLDRVRTLICCVFILLPLVAPSVESNTEVSMEAVTPRYLQPEELHYDSHNHALVFADQYGKKFCRLSLHTGKTTCTPQDETVGAIIPIENLDGYYVAGIGRYLVILMWDGVLLESTYSILRSVEPDKPDNFFNDGAADCEGRLWIGTEGNQGPHKELIPHQASLYHYSKEICNLKKDLDHITASGPIAWNADDSIMYYIDSGECRVDKFNYDKATGEISHRQLVFDFKEHGIDGLPSGMAIDTNDNLWIALYGASKIVQLNPHDTKILTTLELLVSDPTSLTWGGPHLDILYVATSQFRLDEKERTRQHMAGSVIAISGLKARGRRANNVVICRQVEPQYVPGDSWQKPHEEPPHNPGGSWYEPSDESGPPRGPSAHNPESSRHGSPGESEPPGKSPSHDPENPWDEPSGEPSEHNRGDSKRGPSEGPSAKNPKDQKDEECEEFEEDEEWEEGNDHIMCQYDNKDNHETEWKYHEGHEGAQGQGRKQDYDAAREHRQNRH